MTRAPADARLTPAYGRIFLVGVVLLGVLGALVAWAGAWNPRLQAAWFDTCQRLVPRRVDATPVAIVEIDEGSLRRLGQWPWPRTVLADLVRAIERMQPKAIGLEIVMPDADRVAGADIALASAIAAGPVVLAAVGTDTPSGRRPRSPPFVVVDRARDASARGLAIPAYAGAITNLEALDGAAKGQGVISTGSSDEIVRRLPLVARIADDLAPSVALELFRVALGASDVRLLAERGAVRAVRVGEFVARTEADGGIRINYSRHDPRRFRAAAAVLDGSVDPQDLRDKIVLISATAIALADHHDTPLGERMPGGEIQAQLIENLYEGTTLLRPPWAAVAELAAFLVLGAALVAATPRWRPAYGALLALGCVALLVGAGIGAFVAGRLVLDAAHPSLALLILFGALLALTLADARRVRKSLEDVVHAQREQAAYIAGELDAARRIQAGYLPSADALRDEARVDIAAAMLPARDVGGDLYDFFRLDAHRVFFLIGDVAGKGLSASLFMAVSKALYKSAALRHPGASIGELMRIADAEVSRDNPELRFVAAFAALLDLRTGELAYCNAGHDNPYVLRAGAAALQRLEKGGGPPLGAVEAFAYRGSVHRMQAGETLCLVTDGVADAQDRRGEPYGKGRLERILKAWTGERGTTRALVDAICNDVRTFSSGRDLVDDVTVLAVRWIATPTT